MQPPDLLQTARLIERWFSRHQRPLPWRAAYEPYHVWVSEVMLQQTRMEVVLPFFERFLARFPDLAALAAATQDEVLSAWSGLGYYRRAKMLHAGAAVVMDRFEGRIPSTVGELLTIPGVGRYTAGAIASVAFEQRAPIVDGNVARVISRLFALETDAWPRAGELVAACRSPRAFNQGLMELGALVCKPRNPACLLCPVRDHCAARRTGRIDDFPPAKPRKATRELRVSLYLVHDRRGRVLMRRASGSLMDAMYHLPHGDSSLLDGEAFAPHPRKLVGTFRHTITTRRIEFVVYRASVRRRSRGYEWIANVDEVPHPSYVGKALRLAGKAGTVRVSDLPLPATAGRGGVRGGSRERASLRSTAFEETLA